LDLYSASSLKQQSAGSYIPVLGHIILIPSITVCLQLRVQPDGEAANTNFIVFGLTLPVI
jgi:hypothetical protein